VAGLGRGMCPLGCRLDIHFEGSRRLVAVRQNVQHLAFAPVRWRCGYSSTEFHHVPVGMLSDTGSDVQPRLR
jgi:hypothetical protein